MSDELGCTQRYLYEVFTRDIGLAPKDWMRRERMVVARRMLTGGRTPEEVAAGLGFSSANNFRREFLAFYQVPPLRFQADRWGQRWKADEPPDSPSENAGGEDFLLTGMRHIGTLAEL